LGISAETNLKRSEWGMTYGLDGDMVGDERLPCALVFEPSNNKV